MKTRTPIQSRFCDTDLLGHVNNTSFAAYAELGRVDYLRVTGVHAKSIILARLEIDFKAQMHLGGDAWVETSTEAVGTKSITLVQDIVSDGVLVAQTRAVGVFFDYAANRPIPVPDEVRALLMGTQG